MHSTALTSAMTLYRSGTLTLSQAAARSGYSEDELLVALEQFGLSVSEDDGHATAALSEGPARAD